MQISELRQKRREAGFTLVELAIVMIIIGLLIGGILKGQELVANAQVTATIAQIKGLDGALSTFRDKYSAMPGDMTNAGNRLRDCGGACSNNGGANRGDGRINQPAGLGTVPPANQESSRAFTHLAASDLISGVTINGAIQFGAGLPEAKIGGGFWIGYTADGNALGAALAMRPGHYLVLNGTTANAGGANGITATQAAQIDRKMDDGAPRTGDLQSVGTGCVAAGVYAESNVTANCSLYTRVQG